MTQRLALVISDCTVVCVGNPDSCVARASRRAASTVLSTSARGGAVPLDRGRRPRRPILWVHRQWQDQGLQPPASEIATITTLETEAASRAPTGQEGSPSMPEKAPLKKAREDERKGKSPPAPRPVNSFMTKSTRFAKANTARAPRNKRSPLDFPKPVAPASNCPRPRADPRTSRRKRNTT